MVQKYEKRTSVHACDVARGRDKNKEIYRDFSRVDLRCIPCESCRRTLMYMKNIATIAHQEEEREGKRERQTTKKEDNIYQNLSCFTGQLK